MSQELEPSPDSKSLECPLHSEGFLHTCVWQDGPNAFYPETFYSYS
jgi:hypothetical protein